MFITASDLWRTISLYDWCFPRIFTNLARSVFPHNTLERLVLMLKFFIILCLHLLLKTAVVKRFGKLLKILWRISTFYSYQVFPFQFCKNLINSRFQEHRHRVVFTMTYCLQKEKVGKKKFLERNGFDNFTIGIFLYMDRIVSVFSRIRTES